MKTLIVDLDGTLLKSDLLFESFWSACGKDFMAPINALRAVLHGRARLKRYLAGSSDINPKTLPFNEEVVKYIRSFINDGGRAVLVTASDEILARKVVEHLQIFDEGHGSSDSINLKGSVKERFISERFGENSYSYMGDSKADLHVWKSANKAITVNGSSSLKKKVEKLGISCEHMDTTKRLLPYFKALRPHQWLKNILLFVPMLALHDFTLTTFFSSLIALLAFSLVASSVYILNDLLDLTADRSHPRKRFRPVSSGTLSIVHASVMILFLLVLGVFLAGMLGPNFILVISSYYIITTAYSIHFKKVVVLDIFILSILYCTRLIAGGAATNIQLSFWLLAFSFFFFFALASMKRQAELVDLISRNELAASGRGYFVSDLPIMSIMVLVSGYVSVLVMALYVNSDTVTNIYENASRLWGICLILIYWITHAAFSTHRGLMTDDPMIFALKDRISQVCFLLIITIFILGN